MREAVPHDQEPADGFVATSGGHIHYLDWGGRGPNAHLLHANGFCAGAYSPFVRHLLGDLHVFASDIRGHGGSDPPTHRRIRHWNIFAEDLKRLIESTIAAPVVGIGHSLGAVTTYIAAALYPDLFSSIILIDPPILPRRRLWGLALLRLTGLKGRLSLARKARRRRRVFRGKQEALNRFLAKRGIFKTWSREFVEAYLECGLLEKDEETAVLRCDPELEAQIFESIPVDVWRYGPKIRCPVLAVRGAASDTFLPEAAGRLGSIVSRYDLAVISGAGHFVPMERPEACAGAILDFIRRQSESTAGMPPP